MVTCNKKTQKKRGINIMSIQEQLSEAELILQTILRGDNAKHPQYLKGLVMTYFRQKEREKNE